MTLTPRPYQETGRDFLAGRRFALLADEMRVGKTPQAILAAKRLQAEAVIVVCPAIAVAHWHREFERWWPEGNGAIVGSYDWLRNNQSRVLREQWDLAIVDECHFAKNPGAKRTKLVYGKGGLGWISKRMWVLSGTPAPKHAGELWCMLKAFGVIGMAYDEFLRRYCIQDSLGVVRGTRQATIPELKALLATVMLRRTRKEVAPDMPGIDFQFLEAKPTSDADFGVPEGLSDSALEAWLEAHPTADREDRIAVANAKVGPLVDNVVFAVENGLLNQAVVFGWHVEPLVRLANKLNSNGIMTEVINGSTSPKQRELIQERFRSGLTRIVVANILAAGTAIDLSVASQAYFLEMDWVPANNLQAANRLVSMDKQEAITVDVVTWPGSTDDRVQSVLMRRVRELSQLY